VTPALAGLAALAAAFCFAIATVFQFRGAASAPDGAFLRLQLLRHLIREPIWLAGVAAAVVGFGLHLAALSFGSLAVVQPLLVASVLFTLALSPRLAGRRHTRQQWRAGIVAVLALAGFLALTRPGVGRPRLDTTVGVPLLAALTGLAVLVVVAGGRRRVEATIRLGVAAGILYASADGLVKDASGWLATGLAETLIPALIAASLGLVGLLFHQSALHADSPAPVIAAITVTEPVVSVAIGTLAFHERLAAGALGLTGAAVLGAVLVAAVIGVTRDRRPRR
jgi:drug/metabolite transporter (DMT)-like permease